MAESYEHGERMIRTLVAADLGAHIHYAAAGHEEAFHLEEAIVAFGQEMFELGQQLERGETVKREGWKYMQGFFDAMGVIEGGQS